MVIQYRSVSSGCGQHQVPVVPALVASRRTRINARRVAKSSRRAEQLVSRNVTTPHALPSQPVTPPSAALQRQNNLQDE
eukprot:scaffold207091_cov17-Tisochrysis_lutea.AAC.1